MATRTMKIEYATQVASRGKNNWTDLETTYQVEYSRRFLRIQDEADILQQVNHRIVKRVTTEETVG